MICPSDLIVISFLYPLILDMCVLNDRKMYVEYSKSPRIRTYFFEIQAEIGSYFIDTKTNLKV